MMNTIAKDVINSVVNEAPAIIIDQIDEMIVEVEMIGPIGKSWIFSITYELFRSQNVQKISYAKQNESVLDFKTASRLSRISATR